VRTLDNEIKDMLSQLLERQSRLERKITRLETELKKHSIKFETIEKNIKIYAELPNGHKDNSKISFKDNVSLIKEKTDLLSTYQYLKGYIKGK
jgi:DUF438 domain-containing protein